MAISDIRSQDLLAFFQQLEFLEVVWYGYLLKNLKKNWDDHHEKINFLLM